MSNTPSYKRIISQTGGAIGIFLWFPGVLLAEPPAVEFVVVPASDMQTSGPTYDFRISRFEIRNDQFLAFLNNALNNLNNERGQYMFFDVDSDDVYIHNQVTGETGINGSGTLMFDASAGGALRFDAGEYVWIDQAVESIPSPGSPGTERSSTATGLPLNRVYLRSNGCIRKPPDSTSTGGTP